jgi:serine/threonine-protein kinase
MAEISATQWQELNPLLDELLEAQAEVRAQRLAQIRRDDAALANHLEALLRQRTAVERDAFLEGAGFTVAHEPSLAGQTIGAYTLREPIGQGGMGSVWRAERSDGRYQASVAVKFLNLALLGHGGVERFSREGNMLARLSHPNIARLLDAGVAAGSQPYLVLEYIDGVPIDVWCDQRSLGIEARLRLFLEVLAAVAHAHSNLILHRDLKPSNILITPNGEVRLLDFGIGKLIEDQTGAASPTELTQLAGRAFTPDFAAPEQITQGDVTTATDVYALGVLLYLLLTGRHPTAQPAATQVDRLRAVVEAEPTRPSDATTRVKDTDLAVIATARATTPHKLARALRGDLDNILAKALKKSPAERYQTAAAFADDIERQLSGRPVIACPDSATYRVSKFVRRHRVPIGIAAVIAVALAGTAAIAVWQASQARAQARQAELQAARAAAVQTFLTDVFLTSTYGQPDPQKAQSTTARELLLTGAKRIESSLDDAPEAKAQVLRTLGSLMTEFGLHDTAVALHRRRVSILRTLHEDRDTRIADALVELAAAMTKSAAVNERDSVLDEAQRILDARNDSESLSRAELHLQRASLLQYRDWQRSVAYARQAAALYERHNAPAKRAEALSLEADAEYETGNYEAAERGYQATLAILQTLTLGSSHRLLPVVQWTLAEVQAHRLNIVDADRNFREAIETAERIYGRDHDVYIKCIYFYGLFLEKYSQTHKAIPLLRQAVETARRTKGEDETYLSSTLLSGLGNALVNHGLPEEGGRMVARAIALSRASGSNDLGHAQFLIMAARASVESGDLQLASTHLDEASAVIARHDPQAGRALATRIQIGRARLALRANRASEAVEWLIKAGVDDLLDPPRDRYQLLDRLLSAEVHLANGDLDVVRSASQQARTAIERLGLGDAASRELARLDVIDGRLRLDEADAAGATVSFRRALSVRQRVLDPQSPQVAEALIYLAKARRAAGDSAETEQLLKAARVVLAAHPGVAPQFASMAH